MNEKIYFIKFYENSFHILNRNIDNNHKNLDELYEYIIADDDKKKNKPNKKTKINNVSNKKKKKENSLVNGQLTSNSTFNNVNVNHNDMDREIEEFKNKIRYESIHANEIRKVKPKLSVEWIQYVTKM